jgi:hypothetical protein
MQIIIGIIMFVAFLMIAVPACIVFFSGWLLIKITGFVIKKYKQRHITSKKVLDRRDNFDEKINLFLERLAHLVQRFLTANKNSLNSDGKISIESLLISTALFVCAIIGLPSLLIFLLAAATNPSLFFNKSSIIGILFIVVPICCGIFYLKNKKQLNARENEQATRDKENILQQEGLVDKTTNIITKQNWDKYPLIKDLVENVYSKNELIVQKINSTGGSKELLSVQENQMRDFEYIIQTYQKIYDTPKDYSDCQGKLKRAEEALTKINHNMLSTLKDVNERSLNDFEVSLAILGNKQVNI